MSFSGALVRFLLAYLPGTTIVGLLTGAFQAPGLDRSVSYELFLWFVVAVQLLIPTLVAFIIVVTIANLLDRHVVSRLPIKTLNARFVLSAVTGISLPTTQALIWGGHELSINWFLVGVVPASVLGLILIPPDRKKPF